MRSIARPAGTCRDHPRACGEHVELVRGAMPEEGSSPRLRGTFDERLGQLGDAGIIPALAGNMSNWASVNNSRRDHPRACGEHHTQTPCCQCVLGSSPRLRGTWWRAGRGRCADVRRGIIPALAGNITPGGLPGCVPRDHPRACGEHWARVPQGKSCAGSSPRLRGTWHQNRPQHAHRGIIPALAGNILRRSNG